MRALINVALAVLDQMAQRDQRRSFGARIALVGASGLLLLAGAGFLVVAGFLALQDVYGAPAAAAIVGAVLCLIAATVIAVVTRQTKRPSQLSTLATAAVVPAVALGAVDRRDVQAIFDEFRRILESAGSLTAAFFFIGVSAGLLARWLDRRRI